jgi:hypothetical protein
VQPLQELPVPATGADALLLSLEKEAKRENILLATLWHFVHETFSSALLRGRNNSNLLLQLGQQYS